MFLELLPTIWLVGKTTDPTGYWEGSKIELAGAFVLRVEQVPPDGYYQCLCPQEDFQLPLASPGGFVRLASGSGPAFFFFQMTVSALGVRACEIFACAL